MIIDIPGLGDIPECKIYIEIIRSGESTDLGYNRPVIFMLPGGPGGNHTVYNEIKKRMSIFADLVLIDPRGCGYSSKAKVSDCSFETYVYDLEEVRKALQIDSFFLLGGSFGSMAALNYAVKYSDNLLGLILIAGSASGKFIDDAKENLDKYGDEKQRALGSLLLDGKINTESDLAEYYKIMLPLYLGVLDTKTDDGDLDQRPPTTKSSVPYFAELTAYGFSTLLPNYDISERLSEISTPVLILAGGNDWINPTKYQKELEENIPDAKLVVFDQAGHFVWKGRESIFMAEMKDFVETIMSNLYQVGMRLS